jgi:hypothetical protein
MGGRHYNVQQFNYSIPGRIVIQLEAIRFLIPSVVSAEELSDSQPHLHAIDTRIRRRQPCIGNVHVAQLEADIVLRAENVHAQRRLIHKVDSICSGWNVVASQQNSSGQFEVRRNMSVTLKVPLQPQRIEADAICGIRRLKGEEYWNSIDGVLKTAT